MPPKCYICNYYDPKRMSLYRIPNRKDEYSERGTVWLKLLDESKENIDRIRICSQHFLQKKPAKEDDCWNVDWVPNKNLGKYSANQKRVEHYLQRKRNNMQENMNIVKADPKNSSIVVRTPDSSVAATIVGPSDSDVDVLNKFDEPVTGFLNPIVIPPLKKRKIDVLQERFFSPMEIQTELTSEEIDLLFKHYQEAIEERNELLLKISTMAFDVNFFKENDKRTRFYTGLTTWKLLNRLFELIKNFLPDHFNCKLSRFQMFILTLMKLRLNLYFTDLGYRFQIDATTASRYFHRCLYILHKKFRGSKMIRWPERKNLLLNTPSYFRCHFKDTVTIIIDCFELFIERSSVLRAAAQAFSQYKHHETIKYLIGITTTGVIIFISEPFGGRASDKEITLKSGFLDMLKEGDVVLADKGFKIQNEVAAKNAILKNPCFVKEQQQLHPMEVETSRDIASLRIHVEREICILRQKFNMCSDIAQISAISKHNDLFDNDVYDQIVFVCCCLVNICPSVVTTDFEI